MLNTISPESTSSIGAAWPPVDAFFERRRGFYMEGVVEPTFASVDDLVQRFRDEALLTMFPSVEATRASVRAVVEPEAIPLIDTRLPNSIEAAIPLTGEHSERFVLYLGANTFFRTPSSTTIEQHLGRLAHVTAGETGSDITQEDLDERSIDLGFATAGQKTALFDQFEDLYSYFGYDRADTEELLNNPNNLIAYALDRQTGKVVSSAMAETGTIQIHGTMPVTMTEITEAITLPEHRGRGLYRIVSGLLTSQLVDMAKNGADPIHAIYGESNLAMVAVLKAAHQNGRRFSAFDAEELGVTNRAFGVLPQNFTVKDGMETRRYNDFAVSYVPLP